MIHVLMKLDNIVETGGIFVYKIYSGVKKYLPPWT